MRFRPVSSYYQVVFSSDKNTSSKCFKEKLDLVENCYFFHLFNLKNDLININFESDADSIVSMKFHLSNSYIVAKFIYLFF